MDYDDSTCLTYNKLRFYENTILFVSFTSVIIYLLRKVGGHKAPLELSHVLTLSAFFVYFALRFALSLLQMTCVVGWETGNLIRMIALLVSRLIWVSLLFFSLELIPVRILLESQNPLEY